MGEMSMKSPSIERPASADRTKHCGVLLHVSSLPSQFGIGDLGPSAYQFVEFLKRSKQHIWQILPVTPTDPINDNSPYCSNGAFAFNTLFISPELLLNEKLLEKKDLADTPAFKQKRVEFKNVYTFKNKLFHKAYEVFCKRNQGVAEFEKFIELEKYWLDDYALFLTIKLVYEQKSWVAWPQDLKNRHPDALAAFADKYAAQIREVKFYQFLFYKQWKDLSEFASQKGITLMGDMPIYVNHDSADVWAHPQLFKLGRDKNPTVVAGVPPDYFSATGQRWGNPVYDWDKMAEDDYAWWVRRFKQNLDLVKILRVDHFRAFVNYWEIPAEESTAINGKWVNAPTDSFFAALRRAFKSLPLIAEDLGMIEQDVKEKIDALGFPGMKILHFAFNGDLEAHPYLPHNYSSHCVVYTGTHDNNTTRGWWEDDASEAERKNVLEYTGETVDKNNVSMTLIEMALSSDARYALYPMQDILDLGTDCRMNKPGTSQGNWQWRFLLSEETNDLSLKLAQMVIQSGRSH